jgi:hypothetical protein
MEAAEAGAWPDPPKKPFANSWICFVSRLTIRHAGAPPLGQSVEDGPYRGSRGSLEAQLKEESDRLETERALLEERRALLEAVRVARAPRSPFGRFFRTLMLGAALGTHLDPRDPRSARGSPPRCAAALGGGDAPLVLARSRRGAAGAAERGGAHDGLRPATDRPRAVHHCALSRRLGPRPSAPSRRAPQRTDPRAARGAGQSGRGHRPAPLRGPTWGDRRSARPRERRHAGRDQRSPPRRADAGGAGAQGLRSGDPASSSPSCAAASPSRSRTSSVEEGREFLHGARSPMGGHFATMTKRRSLVPALLAAACVTLLE